MEAIEKLYKLGPNSKFELDDRLSNRESITAKTNVLTFPSSKASLSLTNAEPTASVLLEAAVTGGI